MISLKSSVALVSTGITIGYFVKNPDNFKFAAKVIINSGIIPTKAAVILGSCVGLIGGAMWGKRVVLALVKDGGEAGGCEIVMGATLWGAVSGVSAYALSKSVAALAEKI